MTESPARVILHAAYSWTCPACGTQQSVLPALDAEETRRLRNLPGAPAHSLYLVIPERVCCAQCGEEFSTERED